MNSRLLSLSKSATVVALNDSLVSLRTSIDNKTVDCLLDSGASHNFLALIWCKEKGLEVKSRGKFGVRLAGGQEVPAIGKVHCLVDLGPMKTALMFHVLDCNMPCVLGIPFLQTINPTIDWVTRRVQVGTIASISPLEVVNQRSQPQCDIVSAKQFKRGLRKQQCKIDGCFRCKPDCQLMFTHRHAFGETGGDQPVYVQRASKCLQSLDSQFPKVFSEP